GGTADRNRSHWSTSKTPSYTKSVSWQHHRAVAGGTTHIIIAISTMYSLILRQNKTDKKSNESTLIQNLLT
ncbi:hypothetical protein, partial [Escherichia coli]|uniref:hypothetical protein n=1 Tax=Escherichia coli TaxID=562 RepID=UPI001BC83D05